MRQACGAHIDTEESHHCLRGRHVSKAGQKSNQLNTPELLMPLLGLPVRRRGHHAMVDRRGKVKTAANRSVPKAMAAR